MCRSEVARELYSLVLDVKISEDERIQYIEFCKQILIDITIECLCRMCALLISSNGLG